MSYNSLISNPTLHTTGDTQYIQRNAAQIVRALTGDHDRWDGILVPNDTSGMAVGPLVAYMLQVPLAIAIIKEGRCWVHACDVHLDGREPYGLRYVFVDDQISSGRTVRESMAKLNQEDLRATVVGTYEYQFERVTWF